MILVSNHLYDSYNIRKKVFEPLASVAIKPHTCIGPCWTLFAFRSMVEPLR